MKRQLFIYGAGGLGREILSMMESLSEWKVAGFVDDSNKQGKLVHGIEVVGGLQFLQQRNEETHVVVAVGDPTQKERMVKAITNRRIVYPTIVHQSAIIQSRETVRLGAGTIVCAGCVLTTGIHLGDHVLLNINSTIGHDVTIGNFSSVMPGVNISGEVSVGTSALIGSGASIINRIAIGNNATVGMGAVVIRNVDPNTTVVGVPARNIGA